MAVLQTAAKARGQEYVRPDSIQPIGASAPPPKKQAKKKGSSASAPDEEAPPAPSPKKAAKTKRPKRKSKAKVAKSSKKESLLKAVRARGEITVYTQMAALRTFLSSMPCVLSQGADYGGAKE